MSDLGPRFSGISLRARIFVLLTGLAVCLAGWGAGVLWLMHGAQQLVKGAAHGNMTALIAAQRMDSDLAMHSTHVVSFLLDGDSQRLNMAELHRESFEQWLFSARGSTRDAPAHDLLDRIESEYLKYLHYQELLLQQHQAGQSGDRERFVDSARQQFHAVQKLSGSYKTLQEQDIRKALTGTQVRARQAAILSWAALPVGLVTALVLTLVILNRVLIPIRRLAMAGDGEQGGARPLDEVQTLNHRMQDLLADVDDTHSKLRESRAHLEQTEKLALVGKLAAGVAHSIRNPLTSVKMRLFSLERSLELNHVQKEDLEVISEEIRHLDTIIRNFLEFSRPPKLKVSQISPSDVVDTTLSLLRHRLESSSIKVSVQRDKRLPEISADPDQIKEVIVNLMLNACEAMPAGGMIVVTEEQGVMEPQGRVLIIRISDTGPGIPSRLTDQIFQPFFSTKEEGTGLGLSIAKRIMEEHGGWIHARSGEDKGSTFVLALPSKEIRSWHRSL